jgi:energy-coupling factor transport system ATP-binding protein
VSVEYVERPRIVLRGVDLTVDEGEVVLVLGPSGSGKSTLALCLDGLIPHVVESRLVGSVVVADLLTADHKVPRLAREVGLVFQDPESQFCTLSVEAEVAFGLENVRTPPAEIGPAVDAALAAVGLVGFRGRRPDALSGGEQQRVAVAAGLAMGPRVLVLDEPSANLDPRATADLFALLEGFARRRSHTLIVIEHKLDELLHWIDSLLVLDSDGSVLFRGDPRAGFYERGRALAHAGVWRPQTVGLVDDLRGAGWPVPGRPLTVDETAAALRATPGLIEVLQAARGSSRGHRAGLGDPGPGEGGVGGDPGAEPGSETLLEVRHLSFAYPGGPRVLDDVSVRLPRGSFLAVVGANGAGKSTLARLLSGVLRPPEGAVALRGVDLRQLPDPDLTAAVGYVFQNPEHQFVADTVEGELTFSLRGRRGPGGPDDEAQGAQVRSWLQRFGLDHLAEANPFTLSQGQKRRLSVAAMLIRGQEVIILDEPTFGQDQVQTERLLVLLEELHAEGRTVVLVTHDMRLVAEYARSLLVLVDGRVAYDGAPATFFADGAAVAAAGLQVPPLARLADLARSGDGGAGVGVVAEMRPLLTRADWLRAAGRPAAAVAAAPRGTLADPAP